MNKLIYLAIITIMIVISAEVILTKPERVIQIPNGVKNSCLNCHTNMLGGALNSFGVEVGRNHMKAGVIQWTTKLASLDTDKDGFTNGQELLDPNAQWKPGQADPGVQANVGNPGLASSKPIINDVIDFFANKDISISPNPMTNRAEITFELVKTGQLFVEIINLSGDRLRLLANENSVSGNINLVWDCKDMNGYSVPPGLYLVRIYFDGSMISKKLLVQ
jgi:hypothetical protein